ncbi:MAG TPA: hypothetical protein VGQ44_17420 [Gemmatimonadaceae bacterium]|jgi:hypothetical protein|nr:hypothetical protein [Gemmatimonadaceae bacterium]
MRDDDALERYDEAFRALADVMERNNEAMRHLANAMSGLNDALWAMVIDDTFGSTAPPIPNIRILSPRRAIS